MVVTQRKYICSYCAKSFSRSEHRTRHERSHIGIKPYQCKICQHSFVRRDLVQRHIRTVHKLILLNKQEKILNQGIPDTSGTNDDGKLTDNNKGKRDLNELGDKSPLSPNSENLIFDGSNIIMNGNVVIPKNHPNSKELVLENLVRLFIKIKNDKIDNEQTNVDTSSNGKSTEINIHNIIDSNNSNNNRNNNNSSNNSNNHNNDDTTQEDGNSTTPSMGIFHTTSQDDSTDDKNNSNSNNNSNNKNEPPDNNTQSNQNISNNLDKFKQTDTIFNNWENYVIPGCPKEDIPLLRYFNKLGAKLNFAPNDKTPNSGNTTFYNNNYTSNSLNLLNDFNVGWNIIFNKLHWFNHYVCGNFAQQVDTTSDSVNIDFNKFFHINGDNPNITGNTNANTNSTDNTDRENLILTIIFIGSLIIDDSTGNRTNLISFNLNKFNFNHWSQLWHITTSSGNEHGFNTGVILYHNQQLLAINLLFWILVNCQQKNLVNQYFNLYQKILTDNLNYYSIMKNGQNQKENNELQYFLTENDWCCIIAIWCSTLQFNEKSFNNDSMRIYEMFIYNFHISTEINLYKFLVKRIDFFINHTKHKNILFFIPIVLYLECINSTFLIQQSNGNNPSTNSNISLMDDLHNLIIKLNQFFATNRNLMLSSNKSNSLSLNASLNLLNSNLAIDDWRKKILFSSAPSKFKKIINDYCNLPNNLNHWLLLDITWFEFMRSITSSDFVFKKNWYLDDTSVHSLFFDTNLINNNLIIVSLPIIILLLQPKQNFELNPLIIRFFNLIVDVMIIQLKIFAFDLNKTKINTVLRIQQLLINPIIQILIYCWYIIIYRMEGVSSSFVSQFELDAVNIFMRTYIINMEKRVDTDKLIENDINIILFVIDSMEYLGFHYLLNRVVTFIKNDIILNKLLSSSLVSNDLKFKIIDYIKQFPQLDDELQNTTGNFDSTTQMNTNPNINIINDTNINTSSGSSTKLNSNTAPISNSNTVGDSKNIGTGINLNNSVTINNNYNDKYNNNGYYFNLNSNTIPNSNNSNHFNEIDGSTHFNNNAFHSNHVFPTNNKYDNTSIQLFASDLTSPNSNNIPLNSTNNPGNLVPRDASTKQTLNLATSPITVSPYSAQRRGSVISITEDGKNFLLPPLNFDPEEIEASTTNIGSHANSTNLNMNNDNNSAKFKEPTSPIIRQRRRSSLSTTAMPLMTVNHNNTNLFKIYSYGNNSNNVTINDNNNNNTNTQINFNTSKNKTYSNNFNTLNNSVYNSMDNTNLNVRNDNFNDNNNFSTTNFNFNSGSYNSLNLNPMNNNNTQNMNTFITNSLSEKEPKIDTQIMGDGVKNSIKNGNNNDLMNNASNNINKSNDNDNDANNNNDEFNKKISSRHRQEHLFGI